MLDKLIKNLKIEEVKQKDGKLYCVSKDHAAGLIIHNSTKIEMDGFDELSDCYAETLEKYSNECEHKIEVPELASVKYFLDFLNKIGSTKATIETNGEKVIIRSQYWEEKAEYQFKADCDQGEESKKFGMYDITKIRDFLRSFRIGELRSMNYFMKFKDVGEGYHILIIELQIMGHPICEFLLAPVVPP